MAHKAVANFDPTPLLAQELKLAVRGVAAVVELLAGGSTVPFIARYRKEATGGLDEVQLHALAERRIYLTELHERRQVVLASIRDQGKLDAKLEAQLMGCTTKAALEDLYLPFKPKRRTRATQAKEKGLLPLAERMWALPCDVDVAQEVLPFINAEKGVPDQAAALAGARDINAERLAEMADIRALARAHMAQHGNLKSEAIADKTQEPTKFEQYYDFNEDVVNMPSHRFLALRRGEREGFLRLRLSVDAEAVLHAMSTQAGLFAAPGKDSPFAQQLHQAVQDGWTRLLAPAVETDVRVELKMRADREAVDVFASNLRNLLLSAPLGHQTVVGIDPGLRTGCKCVALDATGKFLENTTLYLSQGADALARATQEFGAFVTRHKPNCIAVGNGTGGREAEAFVRRYLAETKTKGIHVLQVSESGASVYSASEVAREEFPTLDVTVRGAISIARRLQDPLAELVKIDPKAIGVGQYQHDVHQPLLQRQLDHVVESCVNHVGVELNTASAPLLARVAGIGGSLAKKVVAFREQRGAFASRMQLCEVPGMGPVSFEQSAGFLRVARGNNPLDVSAVHPERYALVEQMATDLAVDLKSLVGNAVLAKSIDITKYISSEVGEPTLRDIVAELQKPGRDPRASFEPPTFREDVFEMGHLKIGMDFVGVVTNVTAFGAFVDVGVHQDGLVHISQLSDNFVKDPHQAVKVGDKLRVRVLEVDLARKRISLTAKSERPAPSQRPPPKPQEAGSQRRDPRGPKGRHNAGQRGERKPNPQPKQGFSNNPFAKLRGV
jgi:uncharacterized protein